MALHVVVLGAGFGGLELATLLSEALGEGLDLTLIDRSDAFVFGSSKLDVLFGRSAPEQARIPYRDLRKPGVRFRRETVIEIDPAERRVKTSAGRYEADVLVVALGADLDLEATPGVAEVGGEFYSLEGAARLREAVARFERGHAIVGVASAPFKCPPAPSEAALLLHECLERRGVRRSTEVHLVMPFAKPVPPSHETSEALLRAFRETGIRFVPDLGVCRIDAPRRVAVLSDDRELPCDLFLGVPKHVVPTVVAASGMTENGWIPVDPRTLETRFPGVYAIGDVTDTGTPKAGVFSEGAARIVAARILSEAKRGDRPGSWTGSGACYVEFGAGRVGRVDVDFLSGPEPTGTYTAASADLLPEKRRFVTSRKQRWFG